MKEQNLYERYQRQIILKEFGESGQQKLLQSKVLVIGAGGLGCPALQYLAGAGVGTIGIVDDDIVSLNNLHRQILFSTNDIGQPKAERASFYLKQLNPTIRIESFNIRLSAKNAINIMKGFDYVIDGTDNFATRYMINDACVLLDKPLIHGAVSQFEGQVAIFNYKKNTEDNSVNYRDLFPYAPKAGEVLNCEESGVMGVLTGIIGTMMANETIKLISGIGKPLINVLMIYNSLSNQTYSLALTATEESRFLIPADIEAFESSDYEWLCGISDSEMEIDAEAFEQFIHDGNADLIDVREKDEQPFINEFFHLQIPLGQLAENLSSIQKETVVVFCQSGSRSFQAAKTLASIYKNSRKVYSLKDGIIEWKKFQQA
ncbi:MAG TPA: HesA/MoeB/ThiF family protein [Puia sp.]|nr:HesA/MoeB/ThiF family protein [Puia sp.]